jgi:hypothetical protein
MLETATSSHHYQHISTLGWATNPSTTPSLKTSGDLHITADCWGPGHHNCSRIALRCEDGMDGSVLLTYSLTLAPGRRDNLTIKHKFEESQPRSRTDLPSRNGDPGTRPWKRPCCPCWPFPFAHGMYGNQKSMFSPAIDLQCRLLSAAAEGRGHVRRGSSSCWDGTISPVGTLPSVHSSLEYRVLCTYMYMYLRNPATTAFPSPDQQHDGANLGYQHPATALKQAAHKPQRVPNSYSPGDLSSHLRCGN